MNDRLTLSETAGRSFKLNYYPSEIPALPAPARTRTQLLDFGLQFFNLFLLLLNSIQLTARVVIDKPKARSTRQ